VSCDASGQLDTKTKSNNFCIFKESVMRRERPIRHKNNFYIFILKRSVMQRERSVRHKKRKKEERK